MDTKLFCFLGTNTYKADIQSTEKSNKIMLFGLYIQVIVQQIMRVPIDSINAKIFERNLHI